MRIVELVELWGIVLVLSSVWNKVLTWGGNTKTPLTVQIREAAPTEDEGIVRGPWFLIPGATAGGDQLVLRQVSGETQTATHWQPEAVITALSGCTRERTGHWRWRHMTSSRHRACDNLLSRQVHTFASTPKSRNRAWICCITVRPLTVLRVGSCRKLSRPQFRQAKVWSPVRTEPSINEDYGETRDRPQAIGSTR